MKRQILPLIFLILSLLITKDAVATVVYIIERPDGSITFTSRKPVGVRYKVFSSKTTSSHSSYRGKRGSNSINLNREKFINIISEESRRSGVEVGLIKAVIHVESAFNPRALSKKGAMGLMQLMPDTAKFLGVRNAYDPQDNIKGGVKFLAHLLNKYNGNLGLTLAAYNAGEFAVEKHGGIPPFKETINYVRKVVELRNLYKVQ